MTKSTTDNPILDDDAIRHIEALSAKVPDGPWFASADDAEDVPDHRRSGLALVDTGRSSEWWIARLCEWHIANFIAASKTNVDALCATVRALRAQYESAVSDFAAEINSVRAQLEQVTKERDEEKRLRAELKQIAQTGIAEVSSVATVARHTN